MVPLVMQETLVMQVPHHRLAVHMEQVVAVEQVVRHLLRDQEQEEAGGLEAQLLVMPLVMLELLVIQVLLRQVFLKHFLAVLVVLVVMEEPLVTQVIVEILAMQEILVDLVVMVEQAETLLGLALNVAAQEMLVVTNFVVVLVMYAITGVVVVKVEGRGSDNTESLEEIKGMGDLVVVLLPSQEILAARVPVAVAVVAVVVQQGADLSGRLLAVVVAVALAGKVMPVPQAIQAARDLPQTPRLLIVYP
jgi:hypothetical protein